MNAQESVRKSRNGFLAEILARWTNLMEILVIAIFASLGINLIADGLILHAELAPPTSILLGLLFCSISIFYLVGRVTGRRTRFRSYAGFFIYNRDKNEVMPVPRYDFSEDLSRYLKAAFFENKALKAIWDKEPLREPVDIEERRAKGKSKKEVMEMWNKRRALRSYQLIREATEYYALSKLSIHLTDYFNDEKFREENLKEFDRNDVPDVLLKNRFLELFSKPMQDRPAFVEEWLREESEGETVSMYLGEAMYERFDLVLPKESVVRRIGKNEIEIETRGFAINFMVRFDGASTYIPRGFLEHYLSIDDPLHETVEFRADIDVRVSFKFGALLSGTGWEYYQWIDSFLEVLDKSISEDTFFKSIGWSTALTVIKSLIAKPKTKNSKKIKRSRKKETI